MQTPIPIVTNVFVYGTLKRGQCREKMWPRPPLSIRPGFVRGWLFDLGPYPAMWCADCHETVDDSCNDAPCRCDWIQGEIWSLAKQDMAITIEELDEIEETNQPNTCNQYDQILVRVYETPNSSGATASSVLALSYQLSRLSATPAKSRIHPIVIGDIVSWPILRH
ncbi:MAG TPA: hypothetical protein DDZ51_26625 [Planctomycetaceae bacterium]|nr:hypothetical protein [Planctomycetaceae bacterium]